MASMILPGPALVAGNTFPYTLLGIGAASLTVYAANCQTPSYKLGQVEDAIIATEKIRQHAEANVPNYQRPKFRPVYWKHAVLQHGGNIWRKSKKFCRASTSAPRR
ncbi:hypothetical protein B0H14DRAFT_2698285 [Mycena olivaceomarginata]|nr:hypothetical protein B0H14DRAFT_2698285 [Mycena olivaceomarginata]